jgi:hypothetical protein
MAPLEVPLVTAGEAARLGTFHRILVAAERLVGG